MNITEQDLADYCAERGYDYCLLPLTEEERQQLRKEVEAEKNGYGFLDGILSFPRYEFGKAFVGWKD